VEDASNEREPGREEATAREDANTPYPSDPGLKWAAGGGDEPQYVEDD